MTFTFIMAMDTWKRTGGPHCLDHGTHKLRWSSAVCFQLFFLFLPSFRASKNFGKERTNGSLTIARPPFSFFQGSYSYSAMGFDCKCF